MACIQRDHPRLACRRLQQRFEALHREDFAEFTEESTQPGFFVGAGGEHSLGPGAVFLDLEVAYSPLPHEITGDVSTGNVAALAGYCFFLLYRCAVAD